jgi:hypothetical protein
LGRTETGGNPDGLCDDAAVALGADAGDDIAQRADSMSETAASTDGGVDASADGGVELDATSGDAACTNVSLPPFVN